MPRPQKLGWQVQQGRKRSQNQQYHSNTNPSWLKQGSGQFPQKSGAETALLRQRQELWKRRARNGQEGSIANNFPHSKEDNYTWENKAACKAQY